MTLESVVSDYKTTLSATLELKIKIIMCVILKMGHSRPLFVFFSSFQQLTENMFVIKFRRWLDSNRGPLASEASAFPTEPQPLPNVRNTIWITETYLRHMFDFPRIGQLLTEVYFVLVVKLKKVWWWVGALVWLEETCVKEVMSSNPITIYYVCK